MVQRDTKNNRLRLVAYFFLGLALLVITRLFYLQVWRHTYFTTLAAERHDASQKIFPRRGTIFFRDARTGETSIAALDKDYYNITVNPREISPDKVIVIGEELCSILGITDPDKQREVFDNLSRQDTAYRVIAKKVPEEVRVKIDEFTERLRKNLPKKEQNNRIGIDVRPEVYRFYPEKTLAASVLGFGARKDERKPIVGTYGIEGYWNDVLTGQDGLVSGEKSLGGSWITLAGRKIVPAKDGADVVLTIDRNLEYKACERLYKGFIEFKAKSASLVMMDPKTGAILAMCSFPDFDPNNYSAVSSSAQFNNNSIYLPYEPGSVFKPITISAALDLGLITPDTSFVPSDPCKFQIKGMSKPIWNALFVCYPNKEHPGPLTPTYVLQKSINTGMTWIMQNKLSAQDFLSYVEKYGFGQKTGITLQTEEDGSLANLKKESINAYYASFGQGILVTPLQLAAAYSAIANEGRLPVPYVVDHIQYADGRSEKIEPHSSDAIISSRTATLLGGMLVKTFDSYKKVVHVDHYTVAGKTGTAQIFKNGKLDPLLTNHTVVGFAPVHDPKLVVVVRYEEPEPHTYQWAERTAGTTFKEVMEYSLHYFNVPEDR